MPSSLPVVVIKLGSNALLDAAGRLDLAFLDSIAGQIEGVLAAGWQPVVVSSGAVACGLGLLGYEGKSGALSEHQALAAVGQTRLMHHWETALAGRGLHAAQILLTAGDFHDRQRYLNLTAALRALFEMRVVPVVNENDSVSVDELALGDNDRLSALLAGQLAAEHLLLLTDIDGYYTGDPRTDPAAQRVPSIDEVSDEMLEAAGGSGRVGTGGMRSKLVAASLASEAGVCVSIAKAREANVVSRLLAGDDLGTRVAARPDAAPSPRRRWLGLARTVAGSVQLDAGAVQALVDNGRSLLPAGIRQIDGDFSRGDTIALCDADGGEFARGLVSLSSDELRQVIGQRMDEASETLGYPKAARGYTSRQLAAAALAALPVTILCRLYSGVSCGGL